jgi:hypothetical protein
MIGERRMSIDTAINNRSIIYPDKRTTHMRKLMVLNIIRNLEFQQQDTAKHLSDLRQELRVIEELELLFDDLPDIQLPELPEFPNV